MKCSLFSRILRKVIVDQCNSIRNNVNKHKEFPRFLLYSLQSAHIDLSLMSVCVFRAWITSFIIWEKYIKQAQRSWWWGDESWTTSALANSGREEVRTNIPRWTTQKGFWIYDAKAMVSHDLPCIAMAPQPPVVSMVPIAHAFMHTAQTRTEQDSPSYCVQILIWWSRMHMHSIYPCTS